MNIYKRALISILILSTIVLFFACNKAESIPMTIVEEPTITPFTTPQVTPHQVSIIEATPSPTPTPEPTPTPTPTPTPEPTADPESPAYLNMMMDIPEIQLCAPVNGIRLYESSDLSAAPKLIRNTEGDARYSEYIILDQGENERQIPYYEVRVSFGKETGFVPVSKTSASVLSDGFKTGYAFLPRPGVMIFNGPIPGQKLKAQVDYCAARVLGGQRERTYVVTEDGIYGYVDSNLVQWTTRETIENYLIAKQDSHPDSVFDKDAYIANLESYIGTEANTTEEWIYSMLSDAGICFNEVYYHYFMKDFDSTKYPQQFYVDDIYNSLLFKLFNSSGNYALSAGQHTQWDYIDDYQTCEPGDILFFAEYGKKDKPVIPEVEVVMKGPDSGYVTACGIYLGNDSMLTVSNGTVVKVDNLQSYDLFQFFDCARRIQPEVTDLKSHLIEMQISAIYDRLGTPYNNLKRVGDLSYDCSGIISWSLGALGVKQDRREKTPFEDRTASGFCSLGFSYYLGNKLEYVRINKNNKEPYQQDQLERGDYICLLNGSHSKIGHVMMYLGNGRVIHSTTINSKYRGTLVAEIRPALQKLFYNAVRIASISRLPA